MASASPQPVRLRKNATASMRERRATALSSDESSGESSISAVRKEVEGETRSGAGVEPCHRSLDDGTRQPG